MNELLKRVITGVMFGASVIASILIHPFLFATVLFVFLLVGMTEWKNISEKFGVRVPLPIIYLLAIWTFVPFVLFIIEPKYAMIAFITLVLLVPMLGLITIIRNPQNPQFQIVFVLFGVFYICVPFGLLLVLSDPNGLFYGISYQPLFIFGVIWAYDTFAYFTGVMFGKHKLCERLSPKKTWEGLIGGAFITLLLVFFLNPPQLFMTSFEALSGAVVLIAASTFGDLFESMLKRKANMKDSGNFLPGHGGVLDRFDSVFFAVPAYMVLQVLLEFL
jgi:phosphatidate cytidylyltransferase